ncbi:hypothetical protein Vadar_033190 [Vaccinium darrowii]|uniref:Uncharacterized protein n=1 Tax=Vaccinium darrowii TaxID=229202 RepID=A0ACB7Y419_9ERIC|nr:hypothetical protein Vadar_033190 [Vaccinium darrowii]
MYRIGALKECERSAAICKPYETLVLSPCGASPAAIAAGLSSLAPANPLPPLSRLPAIACINQLASATGNERGIAGFGVNLKKASGNDFHSMFTLFVDNLLEDVSIAWFKNLFNKFGVVRDAFIPLKRSKVTGRRFGFVRYNCSVSADVAITKTNGLWIEDRKLYVKIASFEEKGTYQDQKRKVQEQVKGKDAQRKEINVSRFPVRMPNTDTSITGARGWILGKENQWLSKKSFAQAVRGENNGMEYNNTFRKEESVMRKFEAEASEDEYNVKVQEEEEYNLSIDSLTSTMGRDLRGFHGSPMEDDVAGKKDEVQASLGKATNGNEVSKKVQNVPIAGDNIFESHGDNQKHASETFSAQLPRVTEGINLQEVVAENLCKDIREGVGSLGSLRGANFNPLQDNISSNVQVQFHNELERDSEPAGVAVNNNDKEKKGFPWVKFPVEIKEFRFLQQLWLSHPLESLQRNVF